MQEHLKILGLYENRIKSKSKSFNLTLIRNELLVKLLENILSVESNNKLRVSNRLRRLLGTIKHNSFSSVVESDSVGDALLFSGPSLSLFVRDALAHFKPTDASTEDSNNFIFTKRQSISRANAVSHTINFFAGEPKKSNANSKKILPDSFLNRQIRIRLIRTGVIHKLRKLLRRLNSVRCSFRRKFSKRVAHLFIDSLGSSFAGTLRRYHPLVLLRHFTYKKLYSYRKKLSIKTKIKRRYVTRVAGIMHLAPKLPSKVFSNTIIHKTTKFRTHVLRKMNYQSSKHSYMTPLFFFNTLRRVGFRNTRRDLQSRTSSFLRSTTCKSSSTARLFARIRRRVNLSRSKRQLNVTQLLTFARVFGRRSKYKSFSTKRLHGYIRKRIIRMKSLSRKRKLLRKLRKSKYASAIRLKHYVRSSGRAVLSKRGTVSRVGAVQSTARNVRSSASRALHTLQSSLASIKGSFTSDELAHMADLLVFLRNTRTLKKKSMFQFENKKIKKHKKRRAAPGVYKRNASAMPPRAHRINHKVARRAEGRGLAKNSSARAVLGELFNSMRERYPKSESHGDTKKFFRKSVPIKQADKYVPIYVASTDKEFSAANSKDPYTDNSDKYGEVYAVRNNNGSVNRYAFPPLRRYFDGLKSRTGVEVGRVVKGVAQTMHQDKMHKLFPHVARLPKGSQYGISEKYVSRKRYWRGIKTSNYTLPISNKSKYVVRTKKRLARKGSKLRARYRYARVNMLRTLPSFVSMLIRLFYITKSKFDDFIGDDDSNSVDPDLYFDSVLKRFLLF